MVSGFVGAGTVVSGDAEFKGMLRVDGHFTGHIRSEKGSLIVSAGGKVEAEIQVASARINGAVKGDITASQRVELGRSARVHGNLLTPALVIEEGAIFEGSCRMLQAKAGGDKVPKADKPHEAAATARPEATPAKRPGPETVASPPAVKPAPQKAVVTASASKPSA